MAASYCLHTKYSALIPSRKVPHDVTLEVFIIDSHSLAVGANLILSRGRAHIADIAQYYLLFVCTN